MAAKIARPSATTNNASGRQPASRANVASTDNSSGLVFTVKPTKVVAPKRGGRDATVVIPVTVANAFDEMLASNPVGETTDTMNSVTATLTNQQITQWLNAGHAKLVRRVPDPAKRHVDWVLKSITTAEGSPNKLSAAADDKDNQVTIVWTVRYRSQDEYEKLLADRKRRQDAKAAA